MITGGGTLYMPESKMERMRKGSLFAPDDDQAYLTKYLVQVTLPHRQPTDSPDFWERKNGRYSICITPGSLNVNGVRRKLGYPAGAIPRLILLWMNREVVRHGERKLCLGNSLSVFMENIGLNSRNGSLKSARSDRKRLHEQMMNLFRSQIEFSLSESNHTAWKDFNVAPQGEVWWDFYSEGEYLFDSWIELGEHFYQALLQGPVPLSTQALRELKGSSLELDLYSWAVYATYIAMTRREPFRITWTRLHHNLGADYARERDFKRKATAALKKISTVYPDLRLDEEGDNLIVKPSLTPIKPRIRSLQA